MRRKLIAGNWKMNGLVDSGSGLARDLVLRARGASTRIEGDRFLRGLYCHYVFDDQVRGPIPNVRDSSCQSIAEGGSFAGSGRSASGDQQHQI